MAQRARQVCLPGFLLWCVSLVAVADTAVVTNQLAGTVTLHDTRTGEVIWKFDTAREFPTATGAVAKGGAMEGGASALLVDGMLFLNSGYLFNPNMPGNLFIALEVTQ